MIRQFPTSLIKVTRRISLRILFIIFKRLLYKLTSEILFQFNYNIFKETNVCTVGDPFFATLAELDMMQMETGVMYQPGHYLTNDKRITYIVAARKAPLINYKMD